MKSYSILEISKRVQGSRIIGNSDLRVSRVVSIKEIKSGKCDDAIVWLSDQVNEELIGGKEIGLLVLSEVAYEKHKHHGANYLIVNNPRSAIRNIIDEFFKDRKPHRIETSAQIDPDSKIGLRCYIGHNVVVEKNVTIGNDTVILHNTVIMANCQIGNDVTIGANCTIGGDGFGYEKDEEGNYRHLPHIGNVIIENHVHIHDNTCISKGVLNSTIIRTNAKIDNLVHIAHGVEIGRNSIVIANSMIAGSVIIGENSWVAPSASIINGISIAPGTIVGMGSVVVKEITKPDTYLGNPAKTLDEQKKWSEIRKELLDNSSEG